ncbi:MAG: hypothetical protein ACI9HE_002018 [Planctomycetota bacterium]|jgi:hypothetical protein
MLSAFALLSLALLPTQDAASVSPAAPLTLSQRVDSERAAAWVRSLVECGPRMGGTPSGALAAEFLEKTFKNMGLATQVIEGPEKRVYWEEPWTMVAHLGATDSLAAEELTLHQAWPYGFAPSAAGTWPLSLETKAGTVFLSEGVHRPKRKGPKLGAALVDGHCTKLGGWPKLVPMRGTSQNAYPVIGIGSKNGAQLRSWLAAGRSVEIELELTTTVTRARPLTVEASIPAAPGSPPGVFILCAHGDSDAGGPGANDNASGVAVVLSIAAAWQAAIKDGSLPAPPREVRFVIWGSEIHSTRHYLDEHLKDVPCVGVINYDQAGYGSGAEQLNIEPDDLPANIGLVRSLYDLCSERDGTDGFPKRWATNKSLGGTDSYVFSSSKLFRNGGIPAVTVFTSAWDKPEDHPRSEGMPGESWRSRDQVGVDFDHYYHSAGDRPELTTDLEAHNLGWCARVGFLGALGWLDALEN